MGKKLLSFYLGQLRASTGKSVSTRFKILFKNLGKLGYFSVAS